MYILVSRADVLGGERKNQSKKSGWCVRLYICRPVFIEKLKLSVKILVVYEHKPIIIWAQFQFTEHTSAYT